MKNWPRRPRWGPTTGPPFRTSQSVMMKIPRPPSSPVTIPWTAAPTRSNRVMTISSTPLPSFDTLRPGRLHVVEHAPQELLLGAPVGDREVQCQRLVPRERERPPDDEAGGQTVDEPEEAPGHADAIPGEVLSHELQVARENVPSAERVGHRRQEQRGSGHAPEREAEGHAVELVEHSRERVLDALRRPFRIHAVLDLLLVFLVHVDRPQVVVLSEDDVANGQHAGQHGVVLVVVAVQPVAADGLEVLQAGHETPD